MIVKDQKPIKISVNKGQHYAICSCGKTDNFPYCNGAHKGSDKQPTCFVAKEDKDLFICNCEKTNNKPYCDGSHKS